MRSLIYGKDWLTPTDVRSKLAVPPRIVNEFPRLGEDQHFQYLIFRDMEETNLQWLFRLAVRRHGYAKPIVTGQWVEFAHRKGLQPGDGVMFFREENEATGEIAYGVQPFYRRLR